MIRPAGLPSLLLACAACTATDRPPDPLGATPVAPVGATKVTVLQRSYERIQLPGCKTHVSLDIDDITARQVLTRLETSGGDTLVPRRSMHAGDAVAFAVDGKEFTLGLGRLTNLLIGDDFAEFYVGPAAAVGKAQIEDFLCRIEESRLTFVCDGMATDGAKLGKRLRRRRAQAGAKIHTAADFIDLLGRNSASRYSVDVTDPPTPLAVWLGARRGR